MTGMHINVLTRPMEDQNVRAFLAPLLVNRQLFTDFNVSFRLFQQPAPELSDCDILMLNSSFWRGRWTDNGAERADFISELIERVALVLFFDRASTSGTVNADVLRLVKRYYKTNLLCDRSLYQKPLYGLRQFTDYYHRYDGVVDPSPVWSPPVEDASDLGKLRLSWNTGLANYGLFGSKISTLHKYVPLALLMRPTEKFWLPSVDRTIDVSCRMTLNYKYETVAYQRRRLADALQRYRRSERISKSAYYRELRDSKIVTSPFGYSEVNYKDFETFISGGLLLKPDMSHLETYPNLYQENITFIAHDWDLRNLNEVIEGILADYPRYIEIAERGQEVYRGYTVGIDARMRFVNYFLALLDEAESDDTGSAAKCEALGDAGV